MTPILVDERRLAAGLDAALADLAAREPCTFVTPAAFLERLSGLQVVGESERRAIVRRIATTRDDIGIPAHIGKGASFAPRVLAAIDGTGERAPFDAIVEAVTTLLAFANVVSVTDALRRAPAMAVRAPEHERVAIDTALLAGDEAAFAWRRLFATAGIALAPLHLPAPHAPALDPAVLESVEAILCFAASGSDADARRAIASRASGVRIDDARALLTASVRRQPLLEAIDAAKIALGPTARRDAAAFARGLRSVARAYNSADADAGAVVAAVGGAFALDHDPSVAALVRVTRDFDRARTFGPAWVAADLCAEFHAEFAGAERPRATILPGTPASRVAPQERAPVALRRTHFSASSLNTYADCARKWYFRYACAAVEDRGSSASFYGTAFHAALEEFHLRYPRVDGAAPAELGTFLDACVCAAFDRYRARFDAPVEYELQRRRARRTAKKYLQWLLDRAQREPFTVIGCEVATELELDGHAFVGYIDRIDRDDRSGAVTIIDYKTGTIAADAAEYRDDVLAFREFQLPFYYWARAAAGDTVTKLALVPLKDALLDVTPIELTIAAHPPRANGRRDDSPRGTIAIADLERARAQMIAYAQTLSSTTLAAFPATDDPGACRYCAYADACRERPAAAEERFGR